MSADTGPGRGGTALFISPGRAPRSVAFAPAVRGYPGGITDMAGDLDEYGSDVSLDDGLWESAAGAGPGDTRPQAGSAPVEAGSQAPGRRAPNQQTADQQARGRGAPGEHSPGQSALSGMLSGEAGRPVPAPPVSVWQQSAAAWQEAGIDWMRPATASAPPADIPAGDEDRHTEPIPVLAADGTVREPRTGDPARRSRARRPSAGSPPAGTRADADMTAAEVHGAAAEVNGAAAGVNGVAGVNGAAAEVSAAAEAGAVPAAGTGAVTAAGAEAVPAAEEATSAGAGTVTAAEAGAVSAAEAASAPDVVTGSGQDGRGADDVDAGGGGASAGPGEAAGAGMASAGVAVAAGATGPDGVATDGAGPEQGDESNGGGTETATGSTSGGTTSAGHPESGRRPEAARHPETGGRSETGRRMPRRRVMVVAVTALVLVAGALAGIGIARSSGGSPAAPEFALVTPYPPAVAADAELAGQATALPVSLTGIAAAGKTVIAIGAEPSQPGLVPLMLLSTDGGHAWTRAALAGGAAAPPGPGAAPPGLGAGPGLGITGGPGAAAGPGAPAVPGTAAAAGDVPVLIARGSGLWLALGQHGAWVSRDGTTWRQAPGLPPVTGDTVLGLAGTGSGFVAVGEHTGGHPGPVVWTSAGGRPWQRRSGAALGLTLRSGHVTGLRWAAAQKGVFLAGGPISGAARHGRRPEAGLWRSTDGGRTWAPVTLPTAHGATGGLAGLAADGSGFVAVRPGHRAGRKAGKQDAVLYLSAQGSRWRYAGTLTPVRRAALQVTGISGDGHGFVVAATVHSSQVAFFSAHGHRWHQTAYPGTGVAGLVAGPGSAVVVAGNSLRGTGPASVRPHLLLIGPAGGRHQVGQPVLAAAATPDVTVNGLAADGRALVAAGAAGGSPARWLASPAGRWTPAGVVLPGSWRDGALVSVVHGGRGWLAVGQTAAQTRSAQAATGGAIPGASASDQPVILTSATGASWVPAFTRSPLAAPGARFAQAAAGPAGYVVVGSAPALGASASSTSAPGTSVPVAWYSANVGTWARVVLPVPAGYAPGGTAATRQVLAVTARGPGFVAVGSAGSTPAAWTSRGGSAWQFTALPRSAGAAGAVLTKVTAAGGRVVAAGYAWRAGSALAGGRPFTAVSADGGRTWRDSVLPAPPGPGEVTALAAAGHGFVAVGRTGLPGRQVMVAWWSSNGLSWHESAPAGGGLNGPFVMQINAVTAGRGTLTGAGFAASTAAEHPVLWHARYR